jgi:rRNA maturation endonuclease Nob1
MFSDTALDPNHEHYWGCKKIYKRYMIIRCQVCGAEEKRKVDWDKIPVGEVPELNG